MSIDKNKSAAQNKDSVEVYQLKITLRHITPLIWRRVLVKSDTTIAQMHGILQTVMGWEDLHLRQFCIHGKTYGIYRDGGIFFADDPDKVKLSDFKLRKGERFLYEYDMGDWWQHDIRLELVLLLEPRKKYPVCTDGDGDCPPEDCGGPGGFLDLMDERSSWPAMMQMREDFLLVAQRLLDFYAGGPKPTYDEDEFVDALERMREREEEAPIPFHRGEVNAALRQLMKKPHG
jgi:hypothetical protein